MIMLASAMLINLLPTGHMRCSSGSESIVAVEVRVVVESEKQT